ncbi:DUF4956 domain-containing protein [Spirosoma pulveris]
MHQELQQVFNFSITIREVVINTVLATVCGAAVSFFYIATFRGGNYSIHLIKSIVMLSMITAFIMMVIGDNLAQAFGMIGIMSIIQFRSAMKGAQDFMFLFFALALGLACGEGLYAVALSGCLLIGLITVGLSYALAHTRQSDFILNVLRQYGHGAPLDDSVILHSFCKKYKLISTKVSMKGEDTLMKLSYSVRIKKGYSSEGFVASLKEVDGVIQVNLIAEEV